MPTVIGVLKQYKYGTLTYLQHFIAMYTRQIYNLRTYNEREQGLRFALVCYVRVFHCDVFKVNLVRTF